MRCHSSLRTPYWSCATVIASTNDDIADEPAHSEIRKPTETISPLPVRRISATVGSITPVTTSRLKIVRVKPMIFSWTACTTVRVEPVAEITEAPSTPSSSGGNDSVCQNAASAASEKRLPCHAFDSVRASRRSGPLRPDLRASLSEGEPIARSSMVHTGADVSRHRTPRNR